MADPKQILVTNDDGIDSIGLHVLARSMRQFGEVTIVAPDSEYSGAGAAIGAIWEQTPEVHHASVEGIDTAWTVSGPPALCVLYARLATFGFVPDIIVSGINPGANVARSVYHSGTIGAALTGRTGGIPGIAISQSVTDFGVEGQAWGDVISTLRWETAAKVAQICVKAMLDEPRDEPGVLNVNVPDLEFDQLEGFAWSEVGKTPVRSMSEITLTPKPGHTGSFSVAFSYGDAVTPVPGTDTDAILANKVSLTWLSTLHAIEPASPGLDAALNQALHP